MTWSSPMTDSRMRRTSASSRGSECRAFDHGDRVSRRGPSKARPASPCRFALPCTLAYRRPGDPPNPARPATAARCAPASARRPAPPWCRRPTPSCATPASRASPPRRWPTGPGSPAAPSSTTSPRSSRCSPPASPSSSPRSASASTPAPPTRTCSTAPLAVVTDPGDGDLVERIGVLAAAGEASPHARGLILVELHAWLDWLEGWLRRRLGPDATDLYVATLASTSSARPRRRSGCGCAAAPPRRLPVPRQPTPSTAPPPSAAASPPRSATSAPAWTPSAPPSPRALA